MIERKKMTGRVGNYHEWSSGGRGLYVKQGASMTKVEEIILKYHWKFELSWIVKSLEPQRQVFAS